MYEYEYYFISSAVAVVAVVVVIVSAISCVDNRITRTITAARTQARADLTQPGTYCQYTATQTGNTAENPLYNISSSMFRIKSQVYFPAGSNASRVS